MKKETWICESKTLSVSYKPLHVRCFSFIRSINNMHTLKSNQMPIILDECQLLQSNLIVVGVYFSTKSIWYIRIRIFKGENPLWICIEWITTTLSSCLVFLADCSLKSIRTEYTVGNNINKYNGYIKFNFK